MFRGVLEKCNALLTRSRYWLLASSGVVLGLYAGLTITEAILIVLAAMCVTLLYKLEAIYNRPSVRQVDVRVDTNLDPEDRQVLREIRDIMRQGRAGNGA